MHNYEFVRRLGFFVLQTSEHFTPTLLADPPASFLHRLTHPFPSRRGSSSPSLHPPSIHLPVRLPSLASTFVFPSLSHFLRISFSLTVLFVFHPLFLSSVSPSSFASLFFSLSGFRIQLPLALTFSLRLSIRSFHGGPYHPRVYPSSPHPWRTGLPLPRIYF